MKTYVIWTVKDKSYIAPAEKAKLPKKFEHSFEIDSPVCICDKKIGLPAPVYKIEDVSGIISKLFYKLKDDEIDAVKNDLGL